MSATRIASIAIVGRPNVGKSSLFNALVKRRAAIVDDLRGVTRDRLYARAQLDELTCNVIDTGGFEPDSKDPILEALREQARLAIDEADVVLLVVDGRDGLLPPDAELASLLRRSDRPCILTVNKIDDMSHNDKIYEFSELGFEHMLAISAMHRRGLSELAECIIELLPPELAAATVSRGHITDGENVDDELLALAEAAQDSELEYADEGVVDDGPEEISIAVVGRPNVGKSSLINAILGEPRLLVADMPGTTRDAVDTVVEYGGRVYRLIDTAGIRRKRSIGLRVDRYSVVASLNAIARADVAVLVIDATQPVADQDRRVAGRVQEAGKGLVLVANKMDLVDAGERSRREVLEEIKEALLFVKGSALCPTAAKHGKRVFDVLRAIDDVAARQFQRVATSAVNRVLESLAKTHPPPTVGNVRGKLFFGAQVATAPPTFVIVCRRPDAIPPTYRRFVERRLREAFGFDGVPMIVAFRSRERQAERSANQKKRRLKESRE